MSKQFVPPGYVANLAVIEAVAIHLFPQAADEPSQAQTETKEAPVLSAVNDGLDPFAAVVKDGLKSTPLRAAPLYPAYNPSPRKVSAEEERQIFEVLHALRALLYEQKLTAWYLSPLGGGMVEVPNTFWLNDDADHALGSGEYWAFGKPSSWHDKRPVSPLFFREGHVEKALAGQSDGNKKKASSRIGRPDLKPSAKEAYWKVYPNGHNAEGDSWKVAADKVSEKTGERISEDTLQRAVKGE